MARNYREASRDNWVREGGITDEDIRTGCLQRIADATEAMAKNHVQLQRDLAYYKSRLDDEIAAGKRLGRANAALRGALKRAKQLLREGIETK